MTNFLAQLTGKAPIEVQELVLAFEKLSGHQSMDVRLGLEIEKIAAEKIDSLDLDVTDTTAVELYHGLLGRFAADEHRFTRGLGGRPSHSHDQLAPLVIKKLDSLNFPRSAWGLKRTVARELLLANPPKKLMAHTHYRTVDSMLKRESVEELMAAAPFTEPASWRDNAQKLYKKLKASDFESRPVCICPMHSERWAGLPRHGSIVGFVPHMAAVVVWPSPDNRSFGLALAVLILEAVNQVRATASWLEYHQVEPNFHKVLIGTLDGTSRASIKIGSQTIDWRSIFNSQMDKSSLNERIKPDDLEVMTPERALTKLDAELAWWQDTRFAGKIVDERIVSLNMADVAINHANQLNLESASTQWLSETAIDELVARYMNSPWAQDHVLAQMEGA